MWEVGISSINTWTKLDENTKFMVRYIKSHKVQYLDETGLAKRNNCDIFKMSKNIAEIANSPETLLETKIT